MATAEIELNLDDLRKMSVEQALDELRYLSWSTNATHVKARKDAVSCFAFELLDCLPTREDIFDAIIAYLATDDQLRDLLTEQLREELHELLDAPPTVTDNGPPTVRSGELVVDDEIET